MGKNTEKAAEPEVVTEQTETVEQTQQVAEVPGSPDEKIVSESAEAGQSFAADFGKLQNQIADINKGLNPLAQYLRDEGLITNDPGLEVTVVELSDAALSQMKSAQAKIVELEARVEELTPDPSDNPKGKAKSISMPKSVDADDYSTASNVVFADERGKVITDLPSLSFSSEKFLNNATGRTLQEPIEFPVHIPACAVAAVYLVDPKGKAVGVSEMVMPLHVGGGKSARITGGSLLFRAPS